MSNNQSNIDAEPALADPMEPMEQEGLGGVAPDLLTGDLGLNDRQAATHLKATPSKVEEAYQAKLAAGEITKDQLGLIASLAQVGRAQQMNLTALAREIGIHPSRLQRLFTADYGAKLDRVLEKIAAYLALWQERVVMGSGEFVTTSIVETCFQTCDLARAHAIPIPLYGESQLGKTTALEEYAARNNAGAGSVIFVRVPTGGAYGKFVRRLAKALGEATKRNTWELGEHIMTRLNPQKLLIIDEIHQCFLNSAGDGMRIQTIEYIRELYDECGCGMVICGTHIARDAMERGKHADLLDQLRRRGVPPIQLPPVLPDEDLDKIAASYGLPPAPKDVAKWRRELVRSTGLKAYVTFLRMSGTLAAKRKQDTAWSYVVASHDILTKLSSQDKVNGGEK